MALSNEVREDAKNYNEMYDFFEIHFYGKSSAHNKSYSTYGRAYSAASKYVRAGRPLEIIGVSVDLHRDDDHVIEYKQLACC